MRTKSGCFYAAAASAALGCVCGKRGHKGLDRALARCLAQAGPSAGAFYVGPDLEPRALTSMELAALPAVHRGRGRPRTGRGEGGATLIARVSATEYATVAAMAADAGLSMADYIRAMVGLGGPTTSPVPRATGLVPRTTTHVPPSTMQGHGGRGRR